MSESLTDLVARSKREAQEREAAIEAARLRIAGVVVEEPCPYSYVFEGVLDCRPGCEECDGRGVVLSDEGQKLIDFARRWLLQAPR